MPIKLVNICINATLLCELDDPMDIFTRSFGLVQVEGWNSKVLLFFYVYSVVSHQKFLYAEKNRNNWPIKFKSWGQLICLAPFPEFPT